MFVLSVVPCLFLTLCRAGFATGVNVAQYIGPPRPVKALLPGIQTDFLLLVIKQNTKLLQERPADIPGQLP